MGDSSAQIYAVEERLRLAMLHSDVDELDRLISPELIYTNHLGQLLTKQDDLDAHRSGALDIASLVPSEASVRVMGEIAIATVRVRSSGSYAGSSVDGDFRFTRVWAKSSGQPPGKDGGEGGEKGDWQIVAAHCSAIA